MGIVKKVFQVLFTIFYTSINFWAQERPDIYIQTGCLGNIYKICLSPDEKSFVTVSTLEVPHYEGAALDGIMKLWDVESGREIRTFEGKHYKPITSICFSPDGKSILTSSEDKSIKLWDVYSGKEILTYKGIHDSIVRAVVITPDSKYALSGGDDNFIKKWDLKTGVVVSEMDMSDDVYSISIAANGYVLSSLIDGNIKLLDYRDMKVIKSFLSHIRNNEEYSFSTPFKSVISADGKYALLAARFSFELMDLSTGKKILIESSDNLGYCIESIVISSDNKNILYTIRNNPVVHIFSVEEKKDIKLIPLGESNPLCLFKDNNRLLYNTSKPEKGKYELTLGEIAENKKIQTYSGHIPVQVDEIHFLENGNLFLGAGTNFNLWNLDSGKLSVSYHHKWFDGHVGERKLNTRDAISPNGQYCVYALTKKNNSALWNLKTNKLVAMLDNANDVNYAAFSPDSNLLAIGVKNGFRLWDIPYILSRIPANSKPFEISTSKLYVTNSAITAICFSPDGKCLIFGDNGGRLRLTPLELIQTNANLIYLNTYSEFEGHTGKVNNISFSQDTVYAISASDDSTIKLWNIYNGELVRVFKGHEGSVDNAVMSKNNNYILSCSSDKTVKLWDVETGNVLKTLHGHLNNVSSAYFLKNEKYALSCSYDGTVRLWDIFGEKEIAMFACFQDDEWICVTPDGNYTASPNSAKYINIRIGEKVVGLNSLSDKHFRSTLKLESRGKVGDSLRSQSQIP